MTDDEEKPCPVHGVVHTPEERAEAMRAGYEAGRAAAAADGPALKLSPDGHGVDPVTGACPGCGTTEGDRYAIRLEVRRDFTATAREHRAIVERRTAWLDGVGLVLAMVGWLAWLSLIRFTIAPIRTRTEYLYLLAFYDITLDRGSRGNPRRAVVAGVAESLRDQLLQEDYREAFAAHVEAAGFGDQLLRSVYGPDGDAARASAGPDPAHRR